MKRREEGENQEQISKQKEVEEKITKQNNVKNII